VQSQEVVKLNQQLELRVADQVGEIERNRWFDWRRFGHDIGFGIGVAYPRLCVQSDGT
jgi:hypothetical protein